VCIPLLFLLSSYLALYVGLFSMGLVGLCSRPGICFFIIPVLWVALEYIRSFLLTGFPWELMGYSQFRHLHLIQISDMFGVYGVSFLIALSNAALFLMFLCLARKDWHGAKVSKRLATGTMALFTLIFGLVWLYGAQRVKSVDESGTVSPSIKAAIVQGNIDQAKKWDRLFRRFSTQKYIDLSLSAKPEHPDLIVWPETATPFYFVNNVRMTQMVMNGIQRAGSNFLIGSPSFIRKEKEEVDYHNSAYLIGPNGEIKGKYDKVHLVPFGEYVPLKKWLSFAGKIVEHAGDFKPGKKGDTISLGDYRLGVQICYEIIFPNLAGAMVKNGAVLLINITNDAWYGTTSAPYQHFSMTIFRAVENKRSLIRSANTGISGFIDPVGRVIASTSLFEDAVLIHSVPLLNKRTIYTRVGDLFAIICLIIVLFFYLKRIIDRFKSVSQKNLGT
ncbi:apolipoprotein N-acyltransferase, partial [Desulfobacterales bacterium HSG2]|nr:apolipoprotein N-acyltransferase [Desulfobacterales bacterium HSG2]